MSDRGSQQADRLGTLSSKKIERQAGLTGWTDWRAGLTGDDLQTGDLTQERGEAGRGRGGGGGNFGDVGAGGLIGGAGEIS